MKNIFETKELWFVTGSQHLYGDEVLKDVEENSTVVGIPGRVVSRDGRRVHPERDLEHADLPDPIRDKLLELEAEFLQLKKEILLKDSLEDAG